MDTTWSTYVQNTGTLYFSRALRFADRFKERYTEAFGIPDGGRILEIGCGPGALAEALCRWYPRSAVYAVDRDSRFVAFAREKAPAAAVSEGDATALAFGDASFDVTVSHTVAEHVEPAKFYGEQYRVLRENGVCLVLSARRGIHVPAPCVAGETELEQDIWRRAEPYFRGAHARYSVCEYPQSEAELPLCMEKYGFRQVRADYVTVALTPDDPRCPAEMARAMIEANRQNELDNAERIRHVAAAAVTAREVEELKRRIHARYDERIRLYDRGVRQWDTDLTVTMVLRGVK